MYEISFSAGMMAVTAGWILFRGAAALKSKQLRWKYEAIQLLFLINLLVITRFTFYPFSTVEGNVQPLLFDPAAVFPLRVTLIPFLNLMEYDSKSDLLINLIGNFAMFIPSGILIPLIYRKLNSLKKVVLTGGAISLGIEILQLPFAVRASDVDDLILNTAGCLVGFGIYALVRLIRQSCLSCHK